MKIALHRLLGIAAGVTVVAFIVAAIVRHAKHGLGLYVGDVAWFTFLAGVAVVAVLGLTALARRVGRRPATH